MANNKSAKKRIEINERNRLQNRFYKSSVRTFIKVFLKDLEIYKNSKNPEIENLQQYKKNLQKSFKKLEKLLGSVYSLIDKGTKKNVFHKNAAARKKSKLALYLQAEFSSCQAI